MCPGQHLGVLLVQVVLQIVLRVMCEARSRGLSSRRGLCRARPARLRLALSFALQPEARAVCLASSCRPVLGAALVALQTPVGLGDLALTLAGGRAAAFGVLATGLAQQCLVRGDVLASSWLE